MKSNNILIFMLCTCIFFLSACGDSANEQKDLSSFWTTLSESHEMAELSDADDAMISSVYPGLEEINAVQRIVKLPSISFAVNEYVFMECANAEDADKAAAILQKRIDDQVAGAAFYPQSIEAWQAAQVIVHGSYVALIVSAEFTEQDAAAFNALFE